MLPLYPIRSPLPSSTPGSSAWVAWPHPGHTWSRSMRPCIDSRRPEGWWAPVGRWRAPGRGWPYRPAPAPARHSRSSTDCRWGPAPCHRPARLCNPQLPRSSGGWQWWCGAPGQLLICPQSVRPRVGEVSDGPAGPGQQVWPSWLSHWLLLLLMRYMTHSPVARVDLALAGVSSALDSAGAGCWCARRWSRTGLTGRRQRGPAPGPAG